MKVHLIIFLLLYSICSYGKGSEPYPSEAIIIKAHLKARTGIRFSYFDDYLMNKDLVFVNNSTKDTVITREVYSDHLIELKYNVSDISTNQNCFNLFYAKKGDIIEVALDVLPRDLKLLNLGSNKWLFVSDFLTINDTLNGTINANSSLDETIKENKAVLAKNLKVIDSMMIIKDITDSIASLWREAATNFYYLKQTRLGYQNNMMYFESLIKELNPILLKGTNINSTFLVAAVYTIVYYSRLKNKLDDNLKYFVEEVIKINTEQRYKTGIVFQKLKRFPEKKSKEYLESYALFNTKLNDPVFKSKINADEINVNGKSIDKNVIKLVSAQDEYLTLADIFKNNKGKVIVFDFWASWCIPCINEFPYLEKAKTKFANKNVVFIGIGLDKEEKEKAWKNRLEQAKISGKNQFRVLEKSQQLISDLYKIGTIPRYLVFDQNGTLINNQFLNPSDVNFEKKLAAYLTN